MLLHLTWWPDGQKPSCRYYVHVMVSLHRHSPEKRYLCDFCNSWIDFSFQETVNLIIACDFPYSPQYFIQRISLQLCLYCWLTEKASSSRCSARLVRSIQWQQLLLETLSQYHSAGELWEEIGVNKMRSTGELLMDWRFDVGKMVGFLWIQGFYVPVLNRQ